MSTTTAGSAGHESRVGAGLDRLSPVYGERRRPRTVCVRCSRHLPAVRICLWRAVCCNARGIDLFRATRCPFRPYLTELECEITHIADSWSLHAPGRIAQDGVRGRRLV